MNNIDIDREIEKVLSKYENNIDNIFEKGSLQYFCIKSLIINGNIKLNKIEDLILPPFLKTFFRNYNESLVCKICFQATWDSKQRITHMPQDKINELYEVIDELNAFISPSEKSYKIRPISRH